MDLSLRTAALGREARARLLVRKADEVRHIIETGVLVPEPARFFTDAYVALPEEVEPFMAAAGFERRALIGVEGIVSFIEDAVNETDGHTWQAWVDLNYRLGHDPSLLGASEHLLYVGRKGVDPVSRLPSP